MPVKDKYHDTVIRALQKDGWTIDEQQMRLLVDKRRLWIDLRVSRGDLTVTVLIEVKGFENIPSPVDYLYSAVGQYIIYRAIIEEKGPHLPLYMAIPLDAYMGILSEEIGRLTVRKLNIRLIVFDPDSEEIVQWIT